MTAHVAPTCNLNSGDTTWILVSTAFVLFMGPALSFFEAGMLRAKHSLSIITQGQHHPMSRMGPGPASGMRLRKWVEGWPAQR